MSVPSAFSPNGDGRNDVFRPVLEPECPVKGYTMSVYNRWGQCVYSSNILSQGWDGTLRGEPAALGTYVYLLELESGSRNKSIQKRGDVMLVR